MKYAKRQRSPTDLPAGRISISEPVRHFVCYKKESAVEGLFSMLHVGCAVWAYDGWANSFFPPGLPKDERLAAYARRLSAVECNSTFYAVPTLSTVKNWAAQTPETFRFSPKFPRAITHTAQLRNVAAQTASFIGVMRLLGPRLGPLMLQLPPSFGPNRLSILRDYLDNLPEDIQIPVEVRHPGLFTHE